MTNIVLFLTKTLFDLYLFVVILRMLLQLIHADYRNPLSQFCIKLTQPLLTPLQKLTPYYKGIDLAVPFLALIISMLKFIILIGMTTHHLPNMGVVSLISVIDIFQKAITIYFYAIVARALLSWLAPLRYSPILFIINRLTEPLLKRIQKIIPLIAGFDLSPLFALIFLQLLSFLCLEITDMLIRVL